MALKDETKKKQAQTSAANEAPSSGGISPEEREAMLGAEAPENWQNAGNRFLYKPESFACSKQDDKNMQCYREHNGARKYTSPMIQGVPFAVITQPSDYGDNQTYDRIAIKLTRDTFIKTGSADNLQDEKVEAGQVVLVNCQAALDTVADLARDPKVSREVMMRPTHKAPIKGGKAMWFWDVHISPEKMLRVDGPPPPAQLEGNPLA